MIPLKIKFWRHGNVICAKVITQDNSTRGGELLFTSDDGITLASMDNPELVAENVIWIRGAKTNKDEMIVCHDYKTAEHAKEYLEKYINAVMQYNESIFEKDDEADDTEMIIAE